MPLVMKILSLRATWNGHEWIGDKPGYEPILTTLNEMMNEPPGPSAADPYPALTRAQEIASNLHGRIVDKGDAPGFGNAKDEVTVTKRTAA